MSDRCFILSCCVTYSDISRIYNMAKSRTILKADSLNGWRSHRTSSDGVKLRINADHDVHFSTYKWIWMYWWQASVFKVCKELVLHWNQRVDITPTLSKLMAPEIAITLWGRYKLDAISQMTFSNTFSSVQMIEFKFHWSLFLWVELTTFYWFK